MNPMLRLWVAIGFALVLGLGGCDDGKPKARLVRAGGSTTTPATDATDITGGGAVPASVAANATAYFKFSIPSSGTYSVSVTATASNLVWEVFSDQSLATSQGWCDTSQAAGPADETCFLTLSGPLTYYVAVTEQEGVDGTFAIEAAAGAVGVLADGLRVQLGSGLTTPMAAGGTQHYQFTTGSAGAYTVSLTGTSSNLSYSLFATRQLTGWQGNCDTDASAGPDNEICNATLGANANVVVRVDEWDGVAAPFTLTAATGSSGVAVDGGGTPVVASLGVPSSGTLPMGGSLYYEFSSTSAGNYTVSLTALDDDTDAYVYADPGFAYLIGVCNSSSTTSEICNGAVAANTRRFVQVYDFSGIGSAFVFEATPGASGSSW